MTTYITILGGAIRQNLHVALGTALSLVIAVYRGHQIEYGLGATIHGPSRTI